MSKIDRFTITGVDHEGRPVVEVIDVVRLPLWRRTWLGARIYVWWLRRTGRGFKRISGITMKPPR